MKIHIQEEINKLYVKTVNVIARKDSKAAKTVAFAKLSHQWVIAYSYLKELSGVDREVFTKRMYDLRDKITNAITDNLQKKR